MMKRLAAAALLVATGALGTYLVMRRPGSTTPVTAPAAGQATAAAPGEISAAPAGDVTIALTEEAVSRAGIEMATVGTSEASATVRVPGVVQPNAYRSVVVTPIVEGRITRVLVELGQQVRRGQTLAEVYTPELAEAQTRYVSSRAELEAHQNELHRTEKLVEIGAASRQELEKVHAEHTAAATMVASNRSRLRLLGMSDAEIEKLSADSEVGAIVRVAAPGDGVVTAREANVGLNVDASTPLFTIVDLSTVWVVGDVYERDFSRVRVGSPATITTAAYPNLALEATVSYIDPQLKPETRTAQVRVEVPNKAGNLRLGMFADLQLGDGDKTAKTIVVPKSAVQVVGDRSVVYVVNQQEPGKFVEREVKTGASTADQVEILAGVSPGEIVVAKGSFFIRAERERLGLRPPA
jgi:membrane fusion protein, heavy metal efflux system